MHRLPTLTIALAAIVFAAGCDPLPAIQDSHIRANAPADAEFNRVLRRDLDAYFSASGVPNVRTELDFLRQGPTQSGIAYPKYYLWVRVRSGSSVAAEGAVRVAAFEGQRFEVTDFLSTADIRADPDSVGSVFPALLVAGIQERAAAQ